MLYAKMLYNVIKIFSPPTFPFAFESTFSSLESKFAARP